MTVNVCAPNKKSFKPDEAKTDKSKGRNKFSIINIYQISNKTTRQKNSNTEDLK